MFIINGNDSYNTDHILKFYVLDDKIYAVFDFSTNYGFVRDEIICCCKDTDDAEHWLNEIHCAIQRGENAWWIKE